MVHYFDHNKIHELISMKECIEVMRALFKIASDENILNPLRSKMELPEPSNGIMGLMPAYFKPYNVMGVKILSIFPGNHRKGLSSHQGIFHLFETETGQLLANFDAHTMTEMRTAAVSALVTDYTAIPNAESLGILGTGTQAYSHLHAITLVREVKTVFVYGRNQENLNSFIQKVSGLYPSITFTKCSTAQEAANASDIVCTVTGAKSPLISQKGMRSHVHINAVGAWDPNHTELASDIVLNSAVIVDNYNAAEQQKGELILAANEIETAPKDLIEKSLYELVSQNNCSYQNKPSIFASLGLAIEDLAFAYTVYTKFNKKQTA
ncbi:ornithine cyclodeaminase family protein [Cellulophaga sp. HaHa_2_95]|uniref:ornithine cyclodeaminase family protein n=1 Tax=Cellulophaga sp. HaHa_2_95 TaxID=2745558 RepID=UPI001C4E3E77|nr:ornithine cyclodeaminase family protein [Cellulophaga sp. HaHa_2_95]QXP54559.1 ornithine cyclodeaminase family protein [Cellulophaga sp. HaHa_2_95]